MKDILVIIDKIFIRKLLIMELQQSINEKYIEQLLDNKEVDNILELPDKFKYIKLDLRPRLFQAISTLIENKKINGIKISNIDDNHYNYIEYISAIVRSKKLLTNGENYIANYASILKEKLQIMNSFQTLSQIGGNVKGGGTQIINFDWRASFCFWKTVYNIKNEFVDEPFFINKFSILLKQTLTLKKISNNELENIVKIIYELYKNTHDHTFSSNINDLSIRGFYTKRILIKESEIKKYDSYESYLSNIKNNHNEHKNSSLSFIELSVFDSGKGYYHTIKKKSPEETNLEDEIDITLKCFEKHFSSKDTQIHGIGLSFVLNMLKTLNGFMTIRTGRLKISFDGTKDSHKPSIENFSNIKGTSVNIIIPDIGWI